MLPDDQKKASLTAVNVVASNPQNGIGFDFTRAERNRRWSEAKSLCLRFAAALCFSVAAASFYHAIAMPGPQVQNHLPLSPRK